MSEDAGTRSRPDDGRATTTAHRADRGGPPPSSGDPVGFRRLHRGYRDGRTLDPGRPRSPGAQPDHDRGADGARSPPRAGAPSAPRPRHRNQPPRALRGEPADGGLWRLADRGRRHAHREAGLRGPGRAGARRLNLAPRRKGYRPPSGCGHAECSECASRTRRTSSTVAGAACMPECGLRTISSDSTPSTWALWYFTTPSPARSSGSSLSTAMIEWALTSGLTGSSARTLMKGLPGDMLSMLVGIRVRESPPAAVGPSVARPAPTRTMLLGSRTKYSARRRTNCGPAR